MKMFYTMTYGHMRGDLWHERPGQPTMIVASNYLARHSRILRTRPVPRQCRPLFADCGGFYFALKGQDYPFSPQEYVSWLRTMRPDYAATMDYPCEEQVAADDGAVLSRQLRTLEHAATLLAHDVPWQWLPVLQGRSVEHYIRHARMYKEAGLDRPLMGIGSLCRRTRIADILAIVEALHAALPGTRFHLFGVKALIFKQRDALPDCVFSADSAAWNGGFMRGRTSRTSAYGRGLSQAQYELWEALPDYKTRIEQALRQPKQQRLFA